MLTSKASSFYFYGSDKQDGASSTPISTVIFDFLETRIVYFYSICSYDMAQWNTVFVLQWIILTFQIMRFLSDAYVPYEWNNSVAKVVMSISDFVTEIPWVSQMTAYYITIGVFVFVLMSAVFAAVTHYYFDWMLPVRHMRQLLLWLNVLVFPEIIPHFKMIFPCFSYSASSYAMHPFYPDLVCWQGEYYGYFIVSLFIASNVVCLTYLNSMCFYNAEVPNELQYGKQSLNNKYSGNTETAVFTLKMILLALNIAGHSSNWRMAVGALAFVFGCASTYHVVCVVPWWHDTTMTLFIFKGLVFTWTGLCAMLMVAFDDAEGVGMLYFLMFPVLLLAANMLLRWRFMCIAALSAHELDSPVLAILKLHTIVRALTLWLAQFGDVYIEMTPALQAEFDKCGHLSANVIEIAVERFPESVDLHILCAQYYMTVQANRVLAYRSLTLAEKAGGNLDNRFRCRAIRQALEAAAHAQKSEEVKAYTEFKARKEVAEGVLSDAMRSLVQFWTEVMQATPDVDKLATIGERARHQLDVTIAHFERLLQLNRQSIPVLRLYGVLCLEVLGDVARAQELFAQADSVVTNKRKVMLDVNYGSFLGAIPVDVDIFDDKNAVVSISMSPDTIGVVDSVNPAFAQLLGFASSKDVLGKNIKMVVPEPIRSYHDRYLRDYARTRISPVINKTCLVTAVHNHGHLLPCAWYLRWADEAVGQMIATLQPLVNPHEVAFFVDVHTWNITHATANFVSVFGFSKRDVLAQRVKFLDVLPELKDDYGAGQINEEIYGKLTSPRGYEGCGQHAVTQQRFNIHCYLRRTALYETFFLFFRCEVTQMQKDDDNTYTYSGASDIESDLSDLEAVDVLTGTNGSRATSPNTHRDYSNNDSKDTSGSIDSDRSGTISTNATRDKGVKDKSVIADGVADDGVTVPNIYVTDTLINHGTGANIGTGTVASIGTGTDIMLLLSARDIDIGLPVGRSHGRVPVNVVNTYKTTHSRMSKDIVKGVVVEKVKGMGVDAVIVDKDQDIGIDVDVCALTHILDIPIESTLGSDSGTTCTYNDRDFSAVPSENSGSYADFRRNEENCVTTSKYAVSGVAADDSIDIAVPVSRHASFSASRPTCTTADSSLLCVPYASLLLNTRVEDSYRYMPLSLHPPLPRTLSLPLPQCPLPVASPTTVPLYTSASASTTSFVAVPTFSAFLSSCVFSSRESSSALLSRYPTIAASILTFAPANASTLAAITVPINIRPNITANTNIDDLSLIATTAITHNPSNIDAVVIASSAVSFSPSSSLSEENIPLPLLQGTGTLARTDGCVSTPPSFSHLSLSHQPPLSLSFSCFSPSLPSNDRLSHPYLHVNDANGTGNVDNQHGNQRTSAGQITDDIITTNVKTNINSHTYTRTLIDTPHFHRQHSFNFPPQEDSFSPVMQEDITLVQQTPRLLHSYRLAYDSYTAFSYLTTGTIQRGIDTTHTAYNTHTSPDIHDALTNARDIHDLATSTSTSVSAAAPVMSSYSALISPLVLPPSLHVYSQIHERMDSEENSACIRGRTCHDNDDDDGRSQNQCSHMTSSHFPSSSSPFFLPIPSVPSSPALGPTLLHSCTPYGDHHSQTYTRASTPNPTTPRIKPIQAQPVTSPQSTPPQYNGARLLYRHSSLTPPTQPTPIHTHTRTHTHTHTQSSPRSGFNADTYTLTLPFSQTTTRTHAHTHTPRHSACPSDTPPHTTTTTISLTITPQNHHNTTNTSTNDYSDDLPSPSNTVNTARGNSTHKHGCTSTGTYITVTSDSTSISQATLSPTTSGTGTGTGAGAGAGAGITGGLVGNGPNTLTNSMVTTGTGTSLTTSTLLRHRRNAAQKRLKTAIFNDNTRTVHQLRLFTVFASLITALALALVLVDVLSTEADVSHLSVLVRNIELTMERQTYSVFTTLSLYIYHLFTRYPNAVELPGLFTTKVHDFNDAQEYFLSSASLFADMFYEKSLIVDNSMTDSAKLHRLRNEDVLGMYIRDGKKAEKWDKDNMMSLKHAALYYSAAVQWSLYEKKEKVEDDLGYFFAVANLVSGVITNAYDIGTMHVFEEVRDRGKYMFTVSVTIFIVAIIGLGILAALLLIPLLLQVERSKARVLAIFLAIPQSVRKSLRVKAVRVYRLVERVEETGRGMTGHDDDDNEGEGEEDGDMDGGMSMAGSEMTSFSHLTATTASSEDVYAAIFRRYNNFRNRESDFSSDEDVHDRHVPVRENNIHTNNSNKANNGSGTSKGYRNGDRHRISGGLSRHMSYTRNSQSPDGSKSPTGFESPKVAKSPKSAISTHLRQSPSHTMDRDVDRHAPVPVSEGVDMSSVKDDSRGVGSLGNGGRSGRGGSGGGSSGSGDGEEEVVKYNVWTGTAMRMTASRFSVFLCIILAYFATLLILTDHLQHDLYDAVKREAAANDRNRRLGMTFLYTLEHLLHNRNEVKVNNPLDPITFGKNDYAVSALAELEGSKNSMAAVFYGGYHGITRRIPNFEQDQLFFYSACTVNAEKFAKKYPELQRYPTLLTSCGDVEDGLLHRGLYPAFMRIYEQLTILLQPDYNKILSHVLTGSTPTGDPGLAETIKNTFASMYTLYFDYMFHFFSYSNILYSDAAEHVLHEFNYTRYILVAFCFFVLILSIFVLAHPLTVVLGKTVTQTNALMLLLPSQIVRYVPQIRAYIDDNISRD